MFVKYSWTTAPISPFLAMLDEAGGTWESSCNREVHSCFRTSQNVATELARDVIREKKNPVRGTT